MRPIQSPLATVVCVLAPSCLGAAPVLVGAESRIPPHPRSLYSRTINFRPGDGETAALNPPRFSWPYDMRWPSAPENALHEFTLQIAAGPAFADPVVSVRTPLNFYNALPALDVGRQYVWRVGYDVGTDAEVWGDSRSFTITRDAVAWDRSALADPTLHAHPRILFSADNLRAVRDLRNTDPGSRAAWEYMVREADRALAADWWRDFPQADTEDQPKTEFHRIAHDLALVAFVWRMSADDRYAGVLERAVTFAGYPQGGRSSPEGLGGDGAEDATQANEYLALLFDWLYQDLSEEQRAAMVASLEWRAEYWMNSFAWRAKGRGGAMVRLTYSRGNEHLGDQRLALEPTEAWHDFSWDVRPLVGADRVHIDLFNYYRKGTVLWDHFELQPGADGRNLVMDPEMADLRDGAPREWSYSTYGTESQTVVDPEGGRDGGPALGIRCGSSADRGSWSQSLPLTGAGKLHASGRYRTAGMGSDLLVRPGSLSGCISSHQYEGSMDTAPVGLALCEHSEVGREWFELILNYLIGVTNGFGPDEAWNEGPGYGNSKMKWLMNATLYFDTAIPQANLGRSPCYRAIGDFFARVTPVGLPHSPWGNGSANDGYQRGGRLANFRKLAYLTGEGRLLANWQQSGGKDSSPFRPWIEYVLPYYYERPEPEFEADPVHVFPVAGWVTAASRPPSDGSSFKDAVGIIFQCRPRGGYSHSFNSDNSFQIYAYGRQVNHGGGSTVNQDAYAYHTMSHNTILVDGLGQAQPSSGQLFPWYSRIVAFERGEDYVYFAGDATNAYPRQPGKYSRWGLPLQPIYERQACGQLDRFVRHILFLRNRYFVIFDDLRASRPTRFTWLYHILPPSPFRLTRPDMTVRYVVDGLDVLVTHAAHRGEIDLEDRPQYEGMMNPLTGEDYREWAKEGPMCGHNLWVTNSEPRKEMQFLAVVYPYRDRPEPSVQPIDDATVRVDDDVISFSAASGRRHNADFIVDVEAVTP